MTFFIYCVNYLNHWIFLEFYNQNNKSSILINAIYVYQKKEEIAFSYLDLFK